jgi:hypothetical protein
VLQLVFLAAAKEEEIALLENSNGRVALLQVHHVM